MFEVAIYALCDVAHFLSISFFAFERDVHHAPESIIQCHEIFEDTTDIAEYT
eukprot:SAG31_NODE_833_length_11657_cov_3.652535_6_plen_52_part_00